MLGINVTGHIMRLRRAIGWPAYHELDLPFDVIEAIVKSTGAEPWFLSSIQQHWQRGEANSAMDWIVANVSRTDRIFEVGCGCGANLAWLAQHGYVNLNGSDRSTTAIDAAKQLSMLVGLAGFEAEVAEGLVPKARRIDALLAINCLYYAPLDLKKYLVACRDHLAPGGHVILDMVDSSFNDMPNNEYFIPDWHKPVSMRAPSNYVVRMSAEELKRKAAAAGFILVKKLPGTKVPPRYVAVLRMMP